MDIKEGSNPEMLFFRDMMMMMMMILMVIMKTNKLTDFADLRLGVGTELLCILHS
jgi:hypothetical protein